MSEKVALITGGSRGLGRSTALHLAAHGVGVVLTYLNRSAAADEVVADIEQRGGRAVALQLDTGRPSTFGAFAESFKASLAETWNRNDFDFLVNNAGVGAHSSFAETTEETFDQMVDVHFKGVFFLTQALLPVMVDGGRIVNLSSGLARFSLPGYSAYGAVKGAVEVLTRYLAQELGPRSIAVNTVAPGAIETDFGGGVVRDNPDVNAYVAASTAMGRAGLPDDIGGAISSLLVGSNQWITAQRIEVSGGQNL